MVAYNNLYTFAMSIKNNNSLTPKPYATRSSDLIMANLTKSAFEYFMNEPEFRMNIAPKIACDITSQLVKGACKDDIVKSIALSKNGFRIMSGCKEHLEMFTAFDGTDNDIKKEICEVFVRYLFAMADVIEIQYERYKAA